MAEGQKLSVLVGGVASLNTKDISSLVEDNQLVGAENMVFSGTSGVVLRNGTKEFKDNTQWGDDAVIGGIGYKLGSSDAEIMYILESGKIYYSTIDAISADPTVVMNPTATYTLLTTLTITNKDEVFIQVINNEVFISTGGNQIKYYGEDHVIRTVADPVGYEVTMTVSAAVAATIDATYKDAADATRIFNVELTKTGGVGTNLILRQIGGNSRPGATGTLNKLTGTGDANIAWTAVTYLENYIALGERSGRLTAISDEGDTIISEPNDGTDFNGDQSERIPYGKVDGLRVTNLTPFNRGLILSLTEQTLQKSATSLLTGYRKYDTNTPDRTDGLFKIDRESNMVALYGRSGREVGNSFIGLTKNGFINLSALDASIEFGLTDSAYLSRNIQNLVNRVDWSNADDIRSCIDENNQRYWCAVPVIGATGNSLVFVYDFGGSQQALRNVGANHQWSIFTFNIGERTITSLFTIFGHPFMGLSDGSVYIAEIDGYYYDAGETYTSSITTKSFDFGQRLRMKRLTRGVLDLIIPEEITLESYVATDENIQSNDWDRRKIKSARIKPRDLSNSDNWSLQTTDIWTLNPLDVWGRSTSERYSKNLTRSPIFKEISLIIRCADGGKKWGLYGYELEATLERYYADIRVKSTINRALTNPLVQTLIPLVPYLGMLCYSII